MRLQVRTARSHRSAEEEGGIDDCTVIIISSVVIVPSDGICTQVRTARSQWLAEEEGGVDDCTAIVCLLQHGDRSRRTGSVTPSDVKRAATAISRYSGTLEGQSASRKWSASLSYGTLALTVQGFAAYAHQAFSHSD